ncbi:unnamed protein product [Arctogadus glacialis]
MSCVAAGNHPTKDHFRVQVEHIRHQHSWRPCASCPSRGNSTTNQSLSEAGPSRQGSGPITEDHMQRPVKVRAQSASVPAVGQRAQSASVPAVGPRAQSASVPAVGLRASLPCCSS